VASVFSCEGPRLAAGAPSRCSLDRTSRPGCSFAQRVGCIRLECGSSRKIPRFHAGASGATVRYCWPGGGSRRPCPLPPNSSSKPNPLRSFVERSGRSAIQAPAILAQRVGLTQVLGGLVCCTWVCSVALRAAHRQSLCSCRRAPVGSHGTAGCLADTSCSAHPRSRPSRPCLLPS
jgi:hypothetical protein